MCGREDEWREELSSVYILCVSVFTSDAMDEVYVRQRDKGVCLVCVSE